MLEQVDGVFEAIITRRELALALLAEEDLHHASHTKLIEVMQHGRRAQPQRAALLLEAGLLQSGTQRQRLLIGQRRLFQCQRRAGSAQFARALPWAMERLTTGPPPVRQPTVY